MTREEGCEWYQSNRYDFAYNRRGFLGTLKGIYSHALNPIKPVSAFWVKKGGVCFELAYAYD
jgi:hypothetical protein